MFTDIFLQTSTKKQLISSTSDSLSFCLCSWKYLVELKFLHYSYTLGLISITSENYYSQENKQLVVNHAWSVKPEEHVFKLQLRAHEPLP